MGLEWSKVQLRSDEPFQIGEPKVEVHQCEEIEHAAPAWEARQGILDLAQRMGRDSSDDDGGRLMMTCCL